MKRINAPSTIRLYKIYIFNGPEIGNGYIGSETNDRETYKWRNYYNSSSTRLKALIKKNGREKYIKTILGVFPFINKTEVSYTEGFYMDEYNTTNPNGINYYNPKSRAKFFTTGTILSEEKKQRMKKPVDQFNLEGQYIATFSSHKEALQKTGIKVGGSFHTAGGFLWRLSNGKKQNITPSIGYTPYVKSKYSN